MTMRFTLSQILTATLIAALTLALLVNHTRNQRRIETLRRTLAESREHLQTVEYGNATLRLLELNPAIPDDADCLWFLKHELAYSVLMHWESEAAIDKAVDTPGYAKSFAARALLALGCDSTDDFVKLSTSTLWVYPDDELHAAASLMSRTHRVAFDAFVQAARASYGEDGG